jgi:hypothetical protein
MSRSALATWPVLGLVGALLVAPAPAPVFAAEPSKTPSAVYLGYRAALASATTLDDLRPWLSKDGLAKLDSMPKDQRAMMLGMIKDVSSAITNVRVVRETVTGERAELQVEGTDRGTKAKARAVVDIVREGGAWKFVKERWGATGY